MKSVLRILLFLSFFFCAVQSSYSQDSLRTNTKKIGFSFGIGFPDLLNLKLRIPLNQIQLTFGAGFIPAKNETISSFTGDFYYHFAGHSKYTFIRPWFFRVGLDLLKDKADSHTTKYLLLGVRLGREMNITRSFGIDIDAGAAFTLSHSVTGDVIDIRPTVWPLINMSFFFKF